MGVEYQTDTGLALYVLFKDTAIAVDMTEDSGLDLGWYVAADAAIETAGLPAGTYNATVRHGTAAGADASDTVEAVLSGFVWDGTAEVTAPTIEEIEGVLEIGQAAAAVRRHPSIHQLGSLIKLEGTFFDEETGLPIDPDVVKLSIWTPPASVDDPATVIHTYGSSAIVRDSEGHYRFNQDGNVLGTWYYKFWSTGDGQAGRKTRFKIVDWDW